MDPRNAKPNGSAIGTRMRRQMTSRIVSGFTGFPLLLVEQVSLDVQGCPVKDEGPFVRNLVVHAEFLGLSKCKNLNHHLFSAGGDSPH